MYGEKDVLETTDNNSISIQVRRRCTNIPCNGLLVWLVNNKSITNHDAFIRMIIYDDNQNNVELWGTVNQKNSSVYGYVKAGSNVDLYCTVYGGATQELYLYHN